MVLLKSELNTLYPPPPRKRKPITDDIDTDYVPVAASAPSSESDTRSFVLPGNVNTRRCFETLVHDMLQESEDLSRSEAEFEADFEMGLDMSSSQLLSKAQYEEALEIPNLFVFPPAGVQLPESMSRVAEFWRVADERSMKAELAFHELVMQAEAEAAVAEQTE